MNLKRLSEYKIFDHSFYQYFFTLYIGLHVFFSLSLGNITAFAVDEGLYNSIFSTLYTEGFTNEVLGFGGAWVPWLRLVYFPAKVLTFVGFSDLIAVRFLSIAYSTLATFLLIKIAKENARDDWSFKGALVIISFLPTVFLWSSIGLRESFLFLEISAILFFLSRIRKRIEIRNLFGLAFSIYSLSMTKDYIYILFLFSILGTLLILSVFRSQKFLLLFLILGIAVLPLFFKPQLIPAISNFFEGQVTKTTTADELNNNGRCEYFEPCTEEIPKKSVNGDSIEFVSSDGMTIAALLNQLNGNPKTLLSRVSNQLGFTSKLESISKSVMVPETNKSVLENQKRRSLQQANLGSPAQILESSVKFLLVPFLFFDNGSFFLNIQSFETPLWLFIYGLFLVSLYQVIRNRRELDHEVIIAILFVLGFVVLSALIEINVGTAIRHRSLLLIPIVVIWIGRRKNFPEREFTDRI
jgi:hypothetical protein